MFFENIGGNSDGENYPAQAYDLMLSLPIEQQEKLLIILHMAAYNFAYDSAQSKRTLKRGLP